MRLTQDAACCACAAAVSAFYIEWLCSVGPMHNHGSAIPVTAPGMMQQYVLTSRPATCQLDCKHGVLQAWRVQLLRTAFCCGTPQGGLVVRGAPLLWAVASQSRSSHPTEWQLQTYRQAQACTRPQLMTLAFPGQFMQLSSSAPCLSSAHAAALQSRRRCADGPQRPRYSYSMLSSVAGCNTARPLCLAVRFAPRALFHLSRCADWTLSGTAQGALCQILSHMSSEAQPDPLIPRPANLGSFLRLPPPLASQADHGLQ